MADPILIWGAGAIGGTLGFLYYKETSLAKLRADFLKSEEKLAALDFKSEDNVNGLLAEYRTFAAENPGTDIEIRAKIARATILTKTGYPDKALPELEGLSENKKFDKIFRAIALFQVADIYQQQKKYDESVKILENTTLDIFTERRLFELALIYIATNDKAKARSYMERIINEYPNSSFEPAIKSILEFI